MQFIRNETIIKAGKFNSDLSILYDGEQYLAKDGASFIFDDKKIRPIILKKTFINEELYISLVKRTVDSLEIKVYLRNSKLDEIKVGYLTIPNSSQLWELEQSYYNLGILTGIDGTSIVIIHEHIIDMESKNIVDVSPGNSDRLKHGIDINYNFYEDLTNKEVYYIGNGSAFNFTQGKNYEIDSISDGFCKLVVAKDNLLIRANADMDFVESMVVFAQW